MRRSLALASLTVATIAILAHGPGPATAQDKPYVSSIKKFRGPLIYRSVDSGILFYVESDGRHVSAIDPKGKILWCRDPFVDAGLKPYRVKKPVIVYISAPAKWTTEIMTGQGKEGEFIGINFNSTQFGILDAATGDFTFMGQDWQTDRGDPAGSPASGCRAWAMDEAGRRAA